MNRRVGINLAAFAIVFLVMIWWAVNNIISFDFIERPYGISGEFAATAGVAPNSEVAYLGVHYGAVSKVESVDGKVVIDMDIDRGKEIPAGSVARIFRKSAVGEPYIDFDPPEGYTDGGPYLESGDVVPLERTRVPLEFSEMLRAASRVLGSVDAGQTQILIHELAVALDGRGDDLRTLTVSSDALLATLADNTELLDSLSEHSTRLTRTVAQHRGALASSIEDLAALADTLAEVDPAVNVLLDRGTELLGRTANLVAESKQNLDCVLGDLDDLLTVTTTQENLQHLADTLDLGPTAFEYVYATLDDGPDGFWVRVTVLTETDPPTTQYIPPHELPQVPEIPACVSDLRPAGPAYVPDVAQNSLPGDLDQPIAVGGVFILVGALAGLDARRRRTS